MAAQADLCLFWSETPKTGFLVTWLSCILNSVANLLFRLMVFVGNVQKSPLVRYIDYSFLSEPRHDKTNDVAVHPAKTQISLGIHAQSDQSLRCPHEESLGPQLPIECTAKTLIRLGMIRLGGCPSWSESLLGAHSFCWFSHVVAQLPGIVFILFPSSLPVWISIIDSYISSALFRHSS